MANRNAQFLSVIDEATQAEIITSIAEHYQIPKDDVLDEVSSYDAANLLDYMVEPKRSATAVLMQRHGFSTSVISDTQRDKEAAKAKRNELIQAMVESGSIKLGDLVALDRLGRFPVASEHWALCDKTARDSLLSDQHPHVRSCALISSQ